MTARDEHLEEIERLTRALRSSEARERHATERASLLEGGGRALERERALQRVTEGLVRDRTVQEMAETVLDGVGLFDATMIYVGAVDHTSARISLLASRGFEDGALDGLTEIALDEAVPIADAARTGLRIALASREDVRARYPSRQATMRRLGVHAVVVQPVLLEDRVIACIALSFDEPHTLDADEGALLETLARLLAQSLERARIFEAEIAARGALERAVSRLGRLQSVTASLTPQLGTDVIAATILEQVRTALDADGAGLFVPDGDGGLAALGKIGGGRGWDGAEDVRVDSPLAIADAFRSGQMVWVPSQAEWRRRYPAAPADYHAGAGAVLAVPLVVEERTTGVLGLLFRREEALDKEERRLAVTIGQQAAQALERARLYESERRLAERNARLQEVAAALAAAATPADVADVLHGPGAQTAGAASCVVGTVEPDGQRVRLLGRDREQGDTLELAPGSPSPGVESILSRGAVVTTARTLREAEDRSPDLPNEAGEDAWATLPFLTDGGAIGFVTFGFVGAAPDEPSLDALRTMAAQAAQAMDRARLFALEHEVARVLQESLLSPSSTTVPNVEVASRYVAGADHLEVGGDWFEVVHLAQDRVGLAVGDVVGRGLNAAAAMGQLRSALRALALQGIGPIAVLDALEVFAERTTGAELSTVIYGELDPDTGELRFCSAGHPPPILESDGDIEVLDGGRSPLLAAGGAGPRPDHVVRVPPGATLALYTDGLVERRGETFDRGIQRLSRALRATTSFDPEERSDEIIARMLDGAERDDDVALLLVRRAPDADRVFRGWVPPDPSALRGLRHRIAAWLRLRCLTEEDIEPSVLALNEAVANAIEHATSGRHLVEIEAEIRQGALSIDVRDRGRWLDRPSAPERGRGLLLMEALMDEVMVDRTDHGTRVTLRRAVSERMPS